MTLITDGLRALLYSEALWAIALPMILGGLGWLIRMSYANRTALRTVRKVAQDAAEHAEDAKEQVKNSHTTNLRHDMDTKHAEVLAEIRTLGVRVDTLSQAVQTERADRQAGDARTAEQLDQIRRDIAHHHPG